MAGAVHCDSIPRWGDRDPLYASGNTGALAGALTIDKPAASRFLQNNPLNYMVETVLKKQHIVLAFLFFL